MSSAAEARTGRGAAQVGPTRVVRTLTSGDRAAETDGALTKHVAADRRDGRGEKSSDGQEQRTDAAEAGPERADKKTRDAVAESRCRTDKR